MEDEEEAAKRTRLSADNDSAMGDMQPRTRRPVPGSSCEHCIEKIVWNRRWRKIAKARNLFNSPAKLIEISNKYEVLNSEEINETIEVNDNPDNSNQAAEEPGKVEKSKIPPIMLKANQHPQHPGGGTAILIRNNIPHNQITPPNLRYVEACVVAINFKSQDPITLTSIYVPHTSDTSIFTFDIEVLLQINPNQILSGDYNAHHTSWGCNYDCPRGNSIKEFALQTGLEILASSTPTRFGTNSANTIYFAIVKNFLYPYETHSISELSSHHNPITLNFFLQYSIPKYPGKLKTNWKKFKDTLKNSEFINPHFVNTAEHLDSIVCRLEDEIINAKISTSSPVKEIYIYHDINLRELNSERNLARKMFQTYRDPVLKRKLNKLNKPSNKLDQKIETDDLTNELLDVNATDGMVWKCVTPFKKKTKNIPSLNGPAGIANTGLEKANFLAESLETQFTLNNITNPDSEELVADSVMRFRTEANSVCKDFYPLSHLKS
ncbi:hypothetical protein AVEN_67418-1 [Araneus ventricosus]|uniref:Endonuclease/exonuclease/phosphatase domain-containing protein n=1 Tax=Araneus ventricosus TaxID=182803 RepID=A0A4Y2RN72_ARAVE|nr:hypothetical protein AVEN_67418-1 [Araneus ventricosus]